jgi:hypothetical protein
VNDVMPSRCTFVLQGSRSATITEDVIRDVALPLSLVDVKVCAVSPVWSGADLDVDLLGNSPGHSSDGG